ncbi:MAG: hypothetical protein HY301_07885, partial [Verrucomicrobia bacterium]|nr:hypothetical protein [Verrucomicrobiota bacterium]
MKLADLDAAAFAQWVEGAESPTPVREGPPHVVWTERTAPGYGGANFGDTKSPGPRHLRIGFNSAVSTGTVLTRGGGALSVLRPGAPYPGKLDDDSQWLAAERVTDGKISRAEAGREDYAVWSLPPGTSTRALRFTHTAEATEKNFAGWLGSIFVSSERLVNVAPQAVASASANPQKAGLLNNESHDHTWGTWDNFEESGTPLVSERAPEVTLVWPRAVTLRGLSALWAGFGACEVSAFVGPSEKHPKEGAAADWRAVGNFDRLENQYTSPLGVNWLPFAEPVTTRAVRVRLTKVTTPRHPHLDTATKDGRRVWLGELMALSSLDAAPLASAILPAAEQGTHPPIPIRFTLKAAGYVTLVIDDARGVRVRNLVSETFFPAGENVAWWDGTDDLARDHEAAKHGIYHVPGKFVAPGSYRVRGIWHKDVELRYEFPIYTAGSPAWNTEDKTGGWLANHTPPAAALFVPGARAPGGQPLIFLGSYVSEGTHGLAWVNLDGKKIGGVNWLGGNWTGAPFLARDDGPRAVEGVHAYAGSVWQNDRNKPEAELRISALTSKGDKLVLKHTWPLAKLVSKQAEHNVAEEMGGFAVRDGLVVVSLKRAGKLLFAEARGGKILGEVRMESPRGVAFDHEGKLLVLSGTSLRQHTMRGVPQAPALDDGKILVGERVGAGLTPHPGPLPVEGRGGAQRAPVAEPAASGERTPEPASLSPQRGEGSRVRGEAASGALFSAASPQFNGRSFDDPQQLALDEAGNIFVSDRGRSHQVKVFSADGKFLRAIGKPGVPAAGPYDELRMNNPNGLTVDERGRVWVAETDDQPKRVSVWTGDGKFVRAFYGPAEYGGGGRLDAEDKTQFHYHGMTFRLDWARGGFQLEKIFYRADAQPMPLAVRNGPPEQTFTRGGRRYFANCFNSSPTGGAGGAFIFIERDGVAVPAA